MSVGAEKYVNRQLSGSKVSHGVLMQIFLISPDQLDDTEGWLVLCGEGVIVMTRDGAGCSTSYNASFAYKVGKL